MYANEMECPVSNKNDKGGEYIDIWTFVFKVILTEKGRIKIIDTHLRTTRDTSYDTL